MGKQKEAEGFPELNEIDYHNWTYRGSSIEVRKRLNIGNIYLNAAHCNSCGYFIRSRNRHDMVTCKCGRSYVDGGSWYQRLGGEAIGIIELYDNIENGDEQDGEE